MTPSPFTRLFTDLNAAQIRADRSADRIYTCAMIAGLLFAAVCVGVALSLGVE